MKRACLKVLVLLACTCGYSTSYAEQTDVNRYAVLSLIGDRLSVVVYLGETGSYQTPTRKETVPSVTTVFDDAALHGAADAITQLRPGATDKLYSTNAPSLYTLQNRVFDENGDASAARDTIREILKDSGATRVILITKYKSAAHLKLPALNLYTGSGDLEGIGYYADFGKRVRSDMGSRGKGFLSSYAYVRASLLDAKSLAVIREQVMASSEATVNVSTDVDVWNVQTADEKAASLQKVVRLATHDAVSNLLGATD